MPVAASDESNPDGDDIVHNHPVPPETLGRYSPERDADAEQDIANYVHGQARDEEVRHVERIKTEYIMGDAYEIWDVTTDKNRWWVITNGTNLYSQKHFPSLDYTLSFHVGLMMRLRTRSQRPDGDEPQPFDEVLRRQHQASERHEHAIEAVDYQAVGMHLRECLISLVTVLRRRARVEETPEKPQEANFVGWIDLLMNELCRGDKNKQLRQYMKLTSEKTWQLVNWLTHDRDANKTASSIAIGSVDTLVENHIHLLMRESTDNYDQCPVCLSRNIRTHFDMGIEPDGEYYSTCGSCDWSSHPGYSDAENKSEG